MGSPVSVAVANLVMEDVENRALATFPMPLKLWKCYVDDVCTVVPKDQIGSLLQHLNSIEPYIQFTHEAEDANNCLAFLDVQLKHCDDGTISTKVHSKRDGYFNLGMVISVASTQAQYYHNFPTPDVDCYKLHTLYYILSMECVRCLQSNG